MYLCCDLHIEFYCYPYRYACGLLRQGMKQIIVSLDTPEIDSLEKQGNKEAIAKVLHFWQFNNSKQFL